MLEATGLDDIGDLKGGHLWCARTVETSVYVSMVQSFGVSAILRLVSSVQSPSLESRA
jgi:hypothetical protein